jgi:DNA-binding NtrC family response regulator
VLSAEDVKRELARDGVNSPAAAAAPAAGSLGDHRAQAERAAIEEALRKAKGNRSLAARMLGISRRTLYNKMDEHGLS